jgi:hypothetical protein
MSNRNLAAFQPVSKRKLAAAAVENQPAGQSISQLLKILTNILAVVDQFRLREVRGGNPRIPQLKILCDLYRAVLVSRFNAGRAARRKTALRKSKTRRKT